MHNMKKYVVLTFLIFSCFILNAQVKFTDSQNVFSVNFPTKPEYSESETEVNGTFLTLQNYLSYGSENGLFLVSVTDYGKHFQTENDDKIILQNTADGFFGAMDITPGEGKKVKSGSSRGLEYSGNNKTYFVKYRVFLRNGILFQLAILGVNSEPAETDSKSFFKSFKILK